MKNHLTLSLLVITYPSPTTTHLMACILITFPNYCQDVFMLTKLENGDFYTFLNTEMITRLQRYEGCVQRALPFYIGPPAKVLKIAINPEEIP